MNIAAIPLCGAPTSQPLAPENSITQVGLPWMPSLCSRLTTRRELRSPSRPSASGMNFGTMKRLIPFVPSAPSGRRARTRWQTLAVMSLSPQVMKIFCPVIAKVPSPFGTAFVRSAPTSEPACGSVRFIVPDHSPEVSFGRYRALIASLAWCSSASICPLERSGFNCKARQAPDIMSSTPNASEIGRPIPPCSGLAAMPTQPPSAIAR